jgi:hypothetical protein
VYNYENDSWAIFIDSFTCFGVFQPQSPRRWADFTQINEDEWKYQNVNWISRPALIPDIAAGNQLGYVMLIDKLSTNGPSLSIYGITGNTPATTSINIPNHNLETGAVVKIENIPTGTPFATSLNNNIFEVNVTDSSNFTLLKYNSINGKFNLPQQDSAGTYVGGGQISIVDNFSIVSKKFNYLEEGQNIQLGFIDILMNSTTSGAISLYVYLDYNENEPVNILPQNENIETLLPDTFFNSVIPTTRQGGIVGSKYWQRVFCAVRGGFVTLEYTLSNAQMVGPEQPEDVQIDAQIIYTRRAGRQLPPGV